MNGDAAATARQKYACPACGAEARWTPAKHALVCPFCGTESPATLQTRGADTIIVEHDLAAALRDIPDAKRGWQAEKVSVKCRSCQAIRNWTSCSATSSTGAAKAISKTANAGRVASTRSGPGSSSIQPA